MRSPSAAFFALLGALPLAAQPLPTLFDGRSIEGWTVRNGTASFRVENGEIVGRTAAGSPNSFLSPPGEYGDFILEFETKTDPRLNSGVQIRSHEYAQDTSVQIENRGRRERTFPKGRVHGYQVEVANEAAGTSGGIYDEARRGWVANTSENPACRAAFRDNAWNRYRVEARGERIRTWVNGAACADLVDPLDLTGFLGFQVHSFSGDSPAEVRWRDIRLQDLGRHVWKPIFDGRTLDGWEHRGVGRAEVRDGAMVLTGEQGGAAGFVVAGGLHSDFTLRLEYRAVKGNSGLFFRAVELGRTPAPSGVRGYEVEIDPTRDAGGLQEPGGRPWVARLPAEEADRAYRAGDWNVLAVSARGGRIVIHINGEKSVDLADDPGRREGRLALQINSRQSDAEFHYRDIAVLSAEPR